MDSSTRLLPAGMGSPTRLPPSPGGNGLSHTPPPISRREWALPPSSYPLPFPSPGEWPLSPALPPSLPPVSPVSPPSLPPRPVGMMLPHPIPTCPRAAAPLRSPFPPLPSARRPPRHLRGPAWAQPMSWQHVVTAQRTATLRLSPPLSAEKCVTERPMTGRSERPIRAQPCPEAPPPPARGLAPGLQATGGAVLPTGFLLLRAGPGRVGTGGADSAL
ncbi:uncharacterized protein [Heliangelus exortis]|uniref:uncharacterized protein n=1 Tax=Heliangelus exortis TaxID=472823 RepID=UPI003A8F50BE